MPYKWSGRSAKDKSRAAAKRADAKAEKELTIRNAKRDARDAANAIANAAARATARATANDASKAARAAGEGAKAAAEAGRVAFKLALEVARNAARDAAKAAKEKPAKEKELSEEEIERKRLVEMLVDVKLFGRWSTEDVTIKELGMDDYIKYSKAYSKYLPHSAGRYSVKRFRKARCPIVERLACSLMMHGRNSGKKLMAVRIVKHTFEIIHLLSGENPIQVLVNAIINSGPREDSTRIGRQGSLRRQAVDVSPMRRVNQALWLICNGARQASFRNIKTIAECLADELINAAKGSSNSYAIKKKDELERVAKSNR